MSLGGGKSAAINAAAEAAIKAGITVVAAAGNENVCAPSCSLDLVT
jgi:subtilisin family serine protease